MSMNAIAAQFQGILGISSGASILHRGINVVRFIHRMLVGS